MASHELVQSTSASAGERLRLAVGAGLTRLVALWKAARNRRAVVRLLEWDAHMLRDIGLTPGDVHAALSVPMSDDPSRHLSALSQERRRAVRANAHDRLERQGYFLRSMLKGAPLPPLPDAGGTRRRA